MKNEGMKGFWGVSPVHSKKNFIASFFMLVTIEVRVERMPYSLPPRPRRWLPINGFTAGFVPGATGMM